MMKKFLLTAMTCLLTGILAHAQKNQLALNEDSKLTYYQVTDMPATDTLALSASAQAFLKKKYPDIKVSHSNGKADLMGKGKKTMFKKGFLTAQEDAQLDFILKVEFKENKYRVIVTDMMYTPLQRNRYGLSEPMPGKSVPLEQLNTKLKDDQYNAYISYIADYCTQLNNGLHTSLLNPADIQKKPALPKRISTRSW